MPKRIYVGGADGKARKVKKVYIGVGGVAKKIKKAYIGVGGVARPCFIGDGLDYYGAITPLSVGRSHLVATTVGDYALFGGGNTSGNTRIDTVDAYDESLTRSTPTPLSVARSAMEMAATTVGAYAFFGGGSGKTVDAYNKSLTRSIPTPLSVARSSLAATTVGNYALFGGGGINAYNDFDTVDAYDESLTRSTPTPLSVARRHLVATTVGNYALFGGGYDDVKDLGAVALDAVDAYDESLTRSTPTPLSVARYNFAATTVGNYALFGGGINDSSTSSTAYLDAVDAYNKSLTRSIPTPLSVARRHLAATTVGNYALFGGGGGTARGKTVDAYDESLTRSTPTPLSVARYNFAATTVGNYALFGGGGFDRDTVEVYVFIQPKK